MHEQQKWLNPASEYRIHPFWFWNGEMDERETERQIREMADKGVGGFFICARQGLTVPYLSEAWFEKVRYAVDLAAECGLHAWLYDEYPYPSGIAGGEVLLRHPDAKHKVLTHRTKRVGSGERIELELPWGRILYAKAAPIRSGAAKPDWDAAADLSAHIGNLQTEQVFQKVGLTAYNQKRFFTYNPRHVLVWQAPPDGGAWDVLVFIEEEIDEFKYYGTYVDPLRKDAMRTFIELTHQKYAEALGENRMANVKGMFTDEIGLLGDIPWSPVIAEHLRENCGTHAHELLPALLHNTEGRSAMLRYRFFQSMHELLRDNYHRQVHDWCERHGMQYVAEVPSVRMTTQRYSHIPGLDSAHEKLGRSLDWILDRYSHSFRYNPKMTTSLARQLGRDRVLAECFHSVGWSMTLQDAKWMIDRLAAFGVNMFNFHAFYYTTDGLTKHDAPPSQFLQNPYWPHFRLLADYAARLSVLMSEGRMRTDIAVLHPTATIWTHMGNPFHEFKYAGADPHEARRLQRLKDDWHALCKALTLAQRDYDHLDAELLAEAQTDRGRIRLGEAAYSVLIIPPVSCLETAAWDAVRRFAEGGGIVIAVGLLPYQTIDKRLNVEEETLAWFGAERSSAQLYWSGGEEQMESGTPDTVFRTLERSIGRGRVYYIETRSGLAKSRALSELIRIAEHAAPAAVKLETGSAAAACGFLMQHRELSDGSELVFVSNQEGASHEAKLMYKGPLVQTGSKLSAQALELVNGKARELPVAASEDGTATIALAIAPYESHAIRLSASDAASQADDARKPSAAYEAARRAVVRLDAAADWDLAAERDNIVRFGEFELTVNGDTAGTMNVQAKTFIDQAADLAARGSKLPLQFAQTFGIPMEAKLAYSAACRYETSFIVEELPSTCKLLMERGAISGPFTIYVNGHPLTAEQFAADIRYDYLNRSCDIRPCLRAGRNVLRVDVQAERDWDGLVNAIYLAGDFGVEAVPGGEPVLVRKPAVGRVSGSGQTGYPYYAGTFRLSRSFRLEALPHETEFELAFANWDPHFHDVAEVIVNGVSLGACAWSPYRWTGSSTLLQPGDNRVEIRITNTLIGMLEGKRFDDETHALLDI